MQKFFRIFPVIMLFVVLTAGYAFAGSFDTFNIVGEDQSTTVKSVFNLSDTPYLHIVLPDNVKGFVNISTEWSNGSKNFFKNWKLCSTYESESWYTPRNWNRIKDSKKIGEWTVEGTFLSRNNKSGIGCASFAVVTPEPAAIMLYGIGGLPMAFAFLRRRRNEAEV